MVIKSKGFVKSLEAVIASSLILIFVLGLFPAMKTESTIHRDSFELLKFLDYMDTPEFRNNMLLNNLTYAKQQLNTEWPFKNFTVGALKLTSQVGQSSESQTINFQVNEEQVEKEILNFVALNLTNLEISVNSHNILTESNFHQKYDKSIDITTFTQNGSNNLTISGNFNKLNYLLDSYSYSVLIPEKMGVNTVSYFISGNQTIFEPKALVVIK